MSVASLTQQLTLSEILSDSHAYFVAQSEALFAPAAGFGRLSQNIPTEAHRLLDGLWRDSPHQCDAAQVSLDGMAGFVERFVGDAVVAVTV
jgi:hypothetical protein